MARNYRKQKNGSADSVWEIPGELNIKSGGELDIESGGALQIGGTAITSTAAELNILDGVTATTAELNILDGVTSTTAELNKLDGVASSATELDGKPLTFSLDDISTAGSAFVVSPFSGDITKIYCVIDGAIATADAALTTSIGGVAITDGAITVANAGSAAGDQDSATPSAANTVAAGDVISVTTDGASTNTVKATMTFLIKIT